MFTLHFRPAGVVFPAVSTTHSISGLGFCFRTKQPRRPKAEFCLYCAYSVGQFITLAKSGGSFNPSMQKHSVLRPLITLSQGLAVGGNANGWSECDK